jgi:hypothetical protein
MSHFHFRARYAAVLVVMLSTLLIGACGGSSGGDDDDFPKVITLGAGEFFPSITNQALGVGDNRVSIGLMDRDDNRVLDAGVHVRFFELNGDKPRFLSEADARFIPVELSYVDEQSRGEKTVTGSDGYYVVHANFDAPGHWGAKIIVTRDGRTAKPLTFRFNVLDDTPEPGPGDAAPPSRQVTLDVAGSIEDIDTSFPPRPDMHRLTVAEALASGRPAVIAFATPAFCESRTCAPVMETVMDPLYAKYHDRAAFIHIEPYELPQLRQANQKEPVPAMREWRLQSEPWVFVVDGAGRIAAKFQGIMAEDEVEAALVAMLD